MDKFSSQSPILKHLTIQVQLLSSSNSYASKSSEKISSPFILLAKESMRLPLSLSPKYGPTQTNRLEGPILFFTNFLNSIRLKHSRSSTLESRCKVGTSSSQTMSLVSKSSNPLLIVTISASGKKTETCSAARFNAASEGSISVTRLIFCLYPCFRRKSA